MPQFLLRIPFAVVICTFFSFVLSFGYIMSFRFAEYEALASDRQMAILLAVFTAAVGSLISGIPNGIFIGLVPIRMFERFTNGLILSLVLVFLFGGFLFFLAYFSNTDWQGKKPYLIFPRLVAGDFVECAATIFMVRWIFLKRGLREILSNKT